MNDTFRKSVEHWLSACNQHSHETQGFSVALHELIDSELTGTKPVTAWFLDFAPFMFGVVSAKEHSVLRVRIAYLTELRRLQTGAWERLQGDIQQRLEKTKQWVRQNNIQK